MVTIWKYPISISRNFSLQFPREAQILSVQSQESNQGLPALWALVETDQVQEFRQFQIFGTGILIYDDVFKLKFISTFQLDGGKFVGHLFEVIG